CVASVPPRLNRRRKRSGRPCSSASTGLPRRCRARVDASIGGAEWVRGTWRARAAGAHNHLLEANMRRFKKLAPSLVLALVVTACASNTRQPLTAVPAGNYVLVEPASDVYNAVGINEWTFA